MIEIRIDGELIDSTHIISIPEVEEKIESNNKLIGQDYEIELDNIDYKYYDDRYNDNLFSGIDWYDKPLTVFDTKQKFFIWKGLIKKITIDDAKGIITIKSNNIITDLADVTCIYSNNDIYPTEAIKQIILNVIDEEYVDIISFDQVIKFQEVNNIKVSINVTEKDNQKTINIINELCDLTQTNLYSINNKIFIDQHQNYSGELGDEIAENSILPKTYKHYFEDEEINNNYSIAYLNGSVVEYTTGKNELSENKYGVQFYNFPASKNEGTDPAKYKILLNSKASADFLGNLILNKKSWLKKYLEFEIEPNYDIKLGKQYDLTYSTYIREPFLVTEKKYDAQNEKISIKGFFRNIPYNYHDRNINKPDVLELLNVFQISQTSVIVLYSISELNNYELFFASNSEWDVSYSNQGISPLIINSPETLFGNNYTIISGLYPDSIYYFKIRIKNNYYIYSDDSNILSIKLKNDIIWNLENQYMIKGNLYTGLQIDPTNQRNKYIPAEYETYDSTTYDSINYQVSSIYHSPVYNWNVSKIILQSQITRPENKIQLYIRDYENGSFSNWYYITDIDGNFELNPMKPIQFKLDFHICYWSDEDAIFLKELK